MTVPGGRREANKRATRSALLDAAQQQFAERGYAATTVRDIASAAGVTERTFYRYFDGKEGLIADTHLAWLDVLRDAILARPASEDPLSAVQHAMLSVRGHADAGAGPAPLWLFSERQGQAGLQRPGPRPLLRAEAAIVGAVGGRLRAARPAGAGQAAESADEFRAQVIGRVCVAALRSAMIRRRELQARDEPAPGLGELIDEAFAVIGRQQPAAGGPGY
ncbi:MAG TPA: helix-turn-helix domain-containing protein [Streptosporangiaceae bacterium]